MHLEILTVVGARPQFIKAAVVSEALASCPHLQETIVHTGQHYDEAMSEKFFGELGIPKPAYNLGVGSGNHGVQTGRMLARLEEVMLKERPAWVLVYGDTNSTLAGALAAAKLHIPVAHVEAGLRSFNRRMPEEINRVMTDHLASALFAPTSTAVANLQNEGIRREAVQEVGDVMFDTALHFGDKSEASSTIMRRLQLENDQYVLATIHRAENTDSIDRLSAIFHGLIEVSQDLPVVIPLHPRTLKLLQTSARHISVDLNQHEKRIKVIDPVGYLDMVQLEKNAALIATDSGGVQKEAYFYRKPCVTLRAETEWLELVESGANTLCCPSSAQAVSNSIRQSLQVGFHAVDRLYGNGTAANQIATFFTNLQSQGC